MDISKAWLNGRSLAIALHQTGARSRFPQFSPTDRVALDLEQDSYVLGLELTHGFPFVLDDDLMVTIHDFDLTASPPRVMAADSICTLANLRFTRSALESAIHGFIEDTGSNETLRIERMARTLDLEAPNDAYKFSQDVCAWGRGGRVWGNLKRFHSQEELAQAVVRWLRAAKDATSPSEAIRPGTQIKGLGVSFASKHLRLLDPERFASLDEVISLGLGYALNTAGYNLWLHDLHALKRNHSLAHRVGDIESGIFVLIRQIVRGTELEEELPEVEAVD